MGLGVGVGLKSLNDWGGGTSSARGRAKEQLVLEDEPEVDLSEEVVDPGKGGGGGGEYCGDGDWVGGEWVKRSSPARSLEAVKNQSGFQVSSLFLLHLTQ